MGGGVPTTPPGLVGCPNSVILREDSPLPGSTSASCRLKKRARYREQPAGCTVTRPWAQSGRITWVVNILDISELKVSELVYPSAQSCSVLYARTDERSDSRRYNHHVIQ